MTAADLAERIQAKPVGAGKWEASCPGHQDRKASLCIGTGEGGRVLLYCQAGCETAAVVAAAGLRMSDLAPERSQRPGKLGRIVATYSYADEAGAELFQAVRFEPKDFRQRHRAGPGEMADRKGWCWKRGAVRAVVYRLPAVRAAIGRGETIWIAEGEKDVEALERLGLRATCNAGGAGKWKRDHTACLKGAARVVAVADRDAAGRTHVRQVAVAVRAIGAQARIVEVPVGKDASDWIAAGATREDFEQLAESRADPDLSPELEVEGEAATQDTAEIEYGTHPELGAAMLLSLRRGAEEPLVYDQGALYRYSSKSGLYEAVPKEAQELAVQAFDKRSVLSKKGDPQPLVLKQHDVRGAVACGLARAAKPGFFASATPGIAFRDAFVCVTAHGLSVTGHSPTHRATIGVPYDYPRTPNAPLFEKFLARLFLNDEDGELKAQLILEFAGACVIGIATRYQQALVLLGAGSNGKSKLVDILWALFPDGARSAIPIQSFGSEYRRAMLAGKRLNAVAELPGSDLLSAEVVKAIIAGDQVDARHIREAPFTLGPIAGHLFATNEPPAVQDHSFGFWRRLIPIVFLQNFAEASDRDPEIAERIIRQELPGVMGLVLNAAVGLQARKKYLIPPSSVTALAEWKKGADQVALWAEECAEKSDDQARASDVFQDFQAWCSRNGHKGMNSKKFKNRLLGLKFVHSHLHEGRFWRLTLKRAV